MGHDGGGTFLYPTRSFAGSLPPYDRTAPRLHRLLQKREGLTV
jgi:hypothetical protein